MRALLIYGPPGSGKSTHAEALRRHFGRDRVIDEFEPSPGDIPAGNILLLGLRPMAGVDCLPIDAALAAAGLTPPGRG